MDNKPEDKGNSHPVYGAEQGNANIVSDAPCQAARAMLRERIYRLEIELKGLYALDKALPLELPGEADDALFGLLCK